MSKSPNRGYLLFLMKIHIFSKLQQSTHQFGLTCEEFLLSFRMQWRRCWCCEAPQDAVHPSLSCFHLFPNNEKTLILGSQRPGKSGLSESLLSHKQKWRFLSCQQPMSQRCCQELGRCPGEDRRLHYSGGKSMLKFTLHAFFIKVLKEKELRSRSSLNWFEKLVLFIGPAVLKWSCTVQSLSKDMNVMENRFISIIP